MTEEKRRFSRIVYRMEAEFTVPGKIYTVDRIANLSVGGCQLEIGEQLAVGTECSLRIVLNPADRRQNVEVNGEVVRSDGKKAGIKFIGIDPENLHHLHNILLYNADDPDRIEEEIGRHPGLV